MVYKNYSLCIVLFVFYSLLYSQTNDVKTSLKDCVFLKEKKMGALYNDCCISQSLLYKQEVIFKTECTILTNGNYFMDNIHPFQDRYSFDKGDRVNAFAKQNGMLVRGHTLAWYEHVPRWLEKIAAQSPVKARDALRNHIETVLKHTQGNVQYWDVVNEPLTDGGNLRNSFYQNLLGSSYLDSLLTWAHSADSSTFLFINEYGIEDNGEKCDSLYTLATRLLKNNMPLFGIGFQCHLSITDPVDFANMRKAIKRFTSLGLTVHLTEVDIRIPDKSSAQFYEPQNEAYKNITRIFLTEPKCDAMIFWGISDALSWIPQSFKGYGSACLYDKDYQPKSSYFAITSACLELSNSNTKSVKKQATIKRK